MNFYEIDNKYLDYLRQYEKHIHFTTGEKANRKFIGVILEIGEIKYYAPLTSKVKKNHNTDFHIYYNNEITANIRINNMIPVRDASLIKIFDYKINANDNIDELKYKVLLKKEMKYINENIDRLNKLVEKIYNGKIRNPSIFDFKYLEERAKEYNGNNS